MFFFLSRIINFSEYIIPFFKYNENDVYIKVLIFTKLSNSVEWHTRKHGNKEKLLINGFSLFTCKLV